MVLMHKVYDMLHLMRQLQHPLQPVKLPNMGKDSHVVVGILAYLRLLCLHA